MYCFLLALSFLCLIMADKLPDLASTGVPIEVDLPSLDHLDDTDAKLMLERLQGVVKKRLRYWPAGKLDLTLPSSKLIPEGYSSGPKTSLVRLLAASDPMAEELVELAGQTPRRLDPAQRQQLGLTGTFSVNSKRHAGHHHVWKVANWLQKGWRNVVADFQQGFGRVLYGLIMAIPDRLWRSNFSIRCGVGRLGEGLVGIASLLVGLPERVPRYDAAEVDALLMERERDFVYQKLTGAKTEDGTTPEDESSLEEGHRMDVRLFDNSLRKHLQPILDRISTEVQYARERDMEMNDRMRVKAELDAQELSPDEYMRRLVREEGRLRVELLVKKLSNDRELQGKAPGLGKLLGEYELLQVLEQEVELQLSRAVDEEKKRFRAEVTARHPILSLVSEWVGCQVKTRGLAFHQEQKWSFYEKVPALAVEEGLVDLAEVYKKYILPFRREERPQVQRELESERIPAASHSFGRRIWRPSKWIPRDVARHNEAPRYVAQKDVEDVVKTDTPFWRFAVILQRTRANFCNGLYWLFHGFWNGPVGIKSLVLKEPFVSRYLMDATTGSIVPDRAHMTGTLRSRLKGLWKHVRQIRHDFERAPDNGFLGKPVARVLNVLSAYLGIAIPGAILLSIGQPLLTVLHVTVSSVLTITSPVWAPLGSLLEYLFCVTIYDFYQTCRRRPQFGGPLIPLVGYAVYDVGFSGAGRAVLAAVCATIVHPGLSLLGLIWGVFRGTTRTVYDWFMRNTLLRFGRVPAHDTFLAWRIAGPGITSKYCFQIKPEIAVLALEAKLESKELDLFEKAAHEVIERPLRDYRAFFKPFSAFGLVVSDAAATSAVIKKLKTARDDHLKELSKQVTARRKVYGQLCDVGPALEGRDFSAGRRWIKQSKSDSERTLGLGKDMVVAFCGRMKESYPPVVARAVWFDADVTIGNFELLTRHFFEEMFGQTFLEPLEVTDETIVIEIKHTQMEDVLEKLMEPDSINATRMN